MAKCEFPEGCEQEGEPRKMMLDLAQIKDGGIYPWAEHVKATLCDEHHEIVQTDPYGYFPDRVTTTP